VLAAAAPYSYGYLSNCLACFSDYTVFIGLQLCCMANKHFHLYSGYRICLHIRRANCVDTLRLQAAASLVRKCWAKAGSCDFPTEKTVVGVGAQNFNLTFKFPQNGDFRPKFCIFWRKIFRQAKIYGGGITQQTAANFRRWRLWVLEISILPLQSPKLPPASSARTPLTVWSRVKAKRGQIRQRRSLSH